MTRTGCLLEIILAIAIIVALLYLAAQTPTPTPTLPGTLDPVLNHEAYP